MINRIISRIMECLTEEGNLSLTRVIAITGWLAFLIGSFYLLVTGKTWSHYDMFSLFTAGAGGSIQLSNKFINSKYNSVVGGTDQITVDEFTKSSKSLSSKKNELLNS